MKRNFMNLAIFNGDQARIITDALLKGIEEVLLNGLSSEQKQIFSTEHYHQVDPNEYQSGETVTLLKRLFRESGLYPGTIFLPQSFRCTLYLYDLHAMTSIPSFVFLNKEFEEVNALWLKKKTGAAIRMETRPSAALGAHEGEQQHFLIFEFL